LTTFLHFVSRLGMAGTVPPLPPTFIWCLNFWWQTISIWD